MRCLLSLVLATAQLRVSSSSLTLVLPRLSTNQLNVAFFFFFSFFADSSRKAWNSQAEKNGGLVEGQPVHVGFWGLQCYSLGLQCSAKSSLLDSWTTRHISSIHLNALCSFNSLQFILSLNLYDACRPRMRLGFTVYIKTWPWGKRCLTSVFMKQTWVRAHPDLFSVTRSRSHKMCETLLIVDGWKLSSKFSHGHVPCFDSQLVLHCSYGVHCFCPSVELSIVPLTCLSWHGKGSH